MPPSINIQRKVMKHLVRESLNKSSDFWEYAVASSWLESWQNSVCPPKDEDPDVEFPSYAHVSADGHESNEDSTVSVRSVTMSDNDPDNSWIPESQWKLYVSWFGLDPRHTLMRRPYTSLYMSLQPDWSPFGKHVLCDKFLDFLPVWVGDLEAVVNRDTKHFIQVFVWENFSHIEQQIRRVLAVNRNKKVRMWINVFDKNSEILLEPVIWMNQSLISKLIEAVPALVKLMERRQEEQPPYFKFEVLEGDNIRKPLAHEWFGSSLMSISIGIEEVGIDMTTTTKNIWESCSDVQEEFESIVTISSIKNEWDDALATYMNTYMEEMNIKTTDIKDQLMSSARNIVGEKLEDIENIRADYERRFAILEGREEMVTKRELSVKETEADLTARLSRFKTGLQEFQARQQKLDADLKRIESQNRIAESKVVLNIGGHIFSTSITTLSRVEDSFLAVMFSGRYNLQRESDGSFFIDRDGTNFRYILNYLRDGDASVDVIPDNRKLVQELISEAEFYKLPMLKTQLEIKYETLRNMPMESMPHAQHAFQSI